MKKIVGIMSAALMLASSVFAADIAAKVYMTGDIASGNSEGVGFLKLNSTNQKDADALVISTNGDKAGASFQFWYKYDGTSPDASALSVPQVDNTGAVKLKDTDWDGVEDAPDYITASYVGNGNQLIRVRSTKLWFKPIDMVKVTIGDVEGDGFTEMIHWWQDATGASLAQAAGWDGRWSNYNTASGAGFQVEVTPIDGLTATVTVAPGTDNNFIAFASGQAAADFTTAAWGASVAYNLAGPTGLPMNVQLAYRAAAGGNKNYTNRTRIISAGVDYGNNWAAGFYGFLNARFYLASTNGAYAQWNTDPISLRGICLDNYVKYSVGALQVMACLPVTIRLTGDGDPSFMTFDIKATYGLGAFTPYIEIMDNGNAGSYKPIAFDGSNGFGIAIKPGVTFNVGSCALDVAFLADINDGAFNWSVPFTAGVAF